MPRLPQMGQGRHEGVFLHRCRRQQGAPHPACSLSLRSVKSAFSTRAEDGCAQAIATSTKYKANVDRATWYAVVP